MEHPAPPSDTTPKNKEPACFIPVDPNDTGADSEAALDIIGDAARENPEENDSSERSLPVTLSRAKAISPSFHEKAVKKLQKDLDRPFDKIDEIDSETIRWSTEHNCGACAVRSVCQIHLASEKFQGELQPSLAEISEQITLEDRRNQLKNEFLQHATRQKETKGTTEAMRLSLIKQAATSQKHFCEILHQLAPKDEDKDQEVFRIFQQFRSDRDRQAKFEMLINGIVCERKIEAVLTSLAQENEDWSVEAATLDQDVQEGTDFFVMHNGFRVRIDAKSRAALRGIAERREGHISDKEEYVGHKRKRLDDDQQVDVIVLNPEGSSDEESTVAEHSEYRALPSFQDDPKRNDNFERLKRVAERAIETDISRQRAKRSKTTAKATV